MSGAVKRTKFHLILIKRTHYDDDGYPITWLRSHIPSNTLAALYGLGEDCRAREVLGPDVDIVIHPIDETNTRVRPDRLLAQVERSGGKGSSAWSASRPTSSRTRSTRPKFLKLGRLPVSIGGFHVSGCLSMLPVTPPEIQEAMDMGISIFAGEAEEGRFDLVLRDAMNGTMKPLYNYMDDLPNLGGAHTPHCRRRRWRATRAACRASTSAAAARSSARSAPSSTCRAARAVSAPPTISKRSSARTTSRASRRFFITDDNLARNKHWEDFFDRLIELKENEGIQLSLIIQVDTQCHRIPNFIHKARWAASIASSSAWRTSTRTICWPPRSARTRSPNTARCCRPGTTAVPRPGRLHPGLPGRYARIDPARHGDHQEGAAVDILELFMLTPLPGSRITRPCGSRASGWTPTSTSTTCITAACIIRR